MDFMKVFDQTVREIKREVNLKVLKVPEIEQKVLDATDNEPWGPHGSVLAEIAQATKKFSECQIVMSVLWTRLAETGRDWRYVYKALAVIEYLVANGSERAVDDIIEHTFKIASLSAFEYTEPSGKDVGINVRKKAETIVAILNNKDKIQEIRNKASANRDKYFGLSSSGVTYKSGSASFSSAGLRATREGDTFRDSYKDQDQFGEERTGRGTSAKSYRGSTSENNVNSRKGSNHTDHDSLPSSSKALPKIIDSDKYGSKPSQKSAAPSNKYEDDFDDFDPRGASSTKPATESFNQVDLFGQSLVDDLMDTPTPVPSEASTMNSNSADVDLFADATFVSASPGAKSGRNSQILMEDDLFASQPTFPSAPSAAAPSATPIDFFAVPGPAMQSETKSPNSSQINENTFDPFAAVPLNSLDGSDIFGSFTSHADSTSAETRQNPIDNGDPNYSKAKSTDSSTSNKTDGFQVKSGIWADTLSRGLIDLNIAAPKKVSLADIGVVGGLSDGFDERGKGPAPVTYNMGRAMGAGTGLGISGIAPASSGDDIFSHLSSQQNLFGSFKR